MSDRDRRFVYQFWESVHKAMGTNLKFSTAFHPHYLWYQIVDKKEQELKRRTIHYVKVQWRNQSVREATWELEDEMEKYPYLFEDSGMSSLKD